MKYLVAVNEAEIASTISRRFGHSNCFLIVDSDDMTFESVKGVGHDQPRHGVDQFSKYNIERLIVGNIGPGAFSDVKLMGWEVYCCIGMTATDAVSRVQNDEIHELSSPTMKKSVHSGCGTGKGEGKNRK